MKCKNHCENEASSICKCCGETICTECSIDLEGRYYCKKCMARLVNVSGEKRRSKSKFLSLCFSLMPGGGHMYLGLINKGIQIMCSFFGLIFIGVMVSEILYSTGLTEFIIIASCATFIFYSFFDTLRCVNEINSGMYVKDSDMLLNLCSIEDLITKAKENQKNIGYICIILGSIGIFNIFIRIADDFIRRYFQSRIYFSLSNMIFPVLMMIAGVYILRKNNSSEEIKEEE